MANYTKMVNNLTGMEILVPEDLVESYLKAGCKIAGKPLEAEDSEGMKEPKNKSEGNKDK